jgi:hypothetical protein
MTRVELLKPVIELTPLELGNLILHLEDEIKTLIDNNGDIEHIKKLNILSGKLIDILNEK